MSNIKTLRSKDISPLIVLTSLLEKVDELKYIYVVAMEKHEDGGCDPKIYASGDLSQMCVAALCLTETTQKYLRGEIYSE